MLACRFGARRVIAIEPDDSIAVARRLRPPMVMRIESSSSRSFRLMSISMKRLMSSFCDLRGLLPFLGRHIPSLIDARERLLKSNGTLIVQRDDIWAAPISTGDLYHDTLKHWDSYGFDMSAARKIIVNTIGWRVRNQKLECWLRNRSYGWR
ncbi:MAG: hypothetical protein IPG76_22640 [Acidobacteria bacterium]|nr:hypothetical protein [Acidobacteriota bacterium]